MGATCSRSDTGWTRDITLVIGSRTCRHGTFLGNGGGSWSVAFLEPVSCVGTLTIRWSTGYVSGPAWVMRNSAEQLTMFLGNSVGMRHTCLLATSALSMPHWFKTQDELPVTQNCNWLVKSASFQLMSSTRARAVYEVWREDGLWYMCNQAELPRSIYLRPEDQAMREKLVRLLKHSPAFPTEHLALYCTNCGYAKENQCANQRSNDGLPGLFQAGATYMYGGQPTVFSVWTVHNNSGREQEGCCPTHILLPGNP